MQYVCDAAPNLTWFSLETEGEAALESAEMNHAVDKHFRQAFEAAARSWQPPTSARYIEQDIGKKDHIARNMPRFLTLRDEDGVAQVTAMLPSPSRAEPHFRSVVVGRDNRDPYFSYGEAIATLAKHFSVSLDQARCYPYKGRSV